MRILVFSDLHLHNWSYGSSLGPLGMNSRLLDQADILQQIVSIVGEQEIEKVVFAGDMFHTHGKLDAAVLKVAYDGISDLKIALGLHPQSLVMLVGNHDTADKTKAIHSLHWLNEYGMVVDTWMHDCGLSFLSYTERKKDLEMFFKNSGHVCFIHQGISGVPMGSGFLIDETFNLGMIPRHVDHVYAGHYHTHKRVSDKATVIGSPMQFTWADEGEEKGVLIVDTSTGQIEFITLESPKFVTYNMTNAQRAGRHTQETIEGNFVRVINYDETHKEDIRKEFIDRGSRSVEFISKRVEAKPLKPLRTDGFHLPTLVKQYENDQKITEDRHNVGNDIMKGLG